MTALLVSRAVREKVKRSQPEQSCTVQYNIVKELNFFKDGLLGLAPFKKSMKSKAERDRTRENFFKNATVAAEIQRKQHADRVKAILSPKSHEALKGKPLRFCVKELNFLKEFHPCGVHVTEKEIIARLSNGEKKLPEKESCGWRTLVSQFQAKETRSNDVCRVYQQTKEEFPHRVS